MHIDLENRQKVFDSDKARYRLLYVSNDLEFFRALKRILTRPDYDIVYTPHIGTSIILLKGDSRYNLLIIDLELDGKRKGFGLAETTRSIIHRAHLPIVVTANETVNYLNVLGRHPAVNAYLIKKNVSACAETISLLLADEPQTTGYPFLLPRAHGYQGTMGEHALRPSRPYIMTFVLRPRFGLDKSK